ncbi:glycoside hydrolase family 2 protein [Podospora australis]|uniref:Glycoside hydrolase family 2 protein n=1 Tax=Podospora australis TaxID=1536484 RepID=A0AAN7AB46_9PEZI|nr:glycoside hydrolase family 2 protein [Podospora australis]
MDSTLRKGHSIAGQTEDLRQRISINKGWKFSRSVSNNEKLVYDVRSDTPSVGQVQMLNSWVLPSANDFITDTKKHHSRPSASFSGNVTLAQQNFNDKAWETLDLPHDWAIKGPFYVGDGVPVMGGMGRLPIQGVGWYRRQLNITEADAAKQIFLEIDGAMSYSIVWVNGRLVGGWPYGYTSYRLDLTSYLKPGQDSLLAIRLDNPVQSSRWYPGGGIYRNVWITKVEKVHVGQWGVVVAARNVSSQESTVELSVKVDNTGTTAEEVEVITDLHEVMAQGAVGRKVKTLPRSLVTVEEGRSKRISSSTVLSTPKLWGPPPTQQPNLYVAVTRLLVANKTVDSYTTQFGIRSLEFNANKGFFVNGERIRLQGVNEHHDFGALGAAFNLRAAERKLEILRELGVNAIRMSHNPPAPEFLDLTDRYGFVVINESLDCWGRQKNNNDHHLLFSDWSEADTRAMLRRDRNHPSIIAWSVGNEEDSRPCTASKNAARPEMPFPKELDLISLNYQGEGIRDTPPYAGLEGIKTGPSYGDFHKAFPEKMIFSSESAAALSTRGTYLFPVTKEYSAPVTDGKADGGGNPSLRQVSSYELYTTPFGSSADKVFAKQDENNPFVAGEFVWSDFDYLGEPTPYYSARSSYFGIIELAGFKEDRFWLYQARWRPDLPIAHILPHWTWPDRKGLITPVHVFTGADEAELFLNGKSLGRKSKKEGYRFRWDDVVYAPGELSVVTWKDKKPWANEAVTTAGDAKGLALQADRSVIQGDGQDLSFITAKVVDGDHNLVPSANDTITFSVEGDAEIVATDNGDPYDMVPFPSKDRNAFSGLALVIVKGRGKGMAILTASSRGLAAAKIELTLR